MLYYYLRAQTETISLSLCSKSSNFWTDDNFYILKLFYEFFVHFYRRITFIDSTGARYCQDLRKINIYFNFLNPFIFSSAQISMQRVNTLYIITNQPMCCSIFLSVSKKHRIVFVSHQAFKWFSCAALM